ncbi:hypothetical protein EHW66_04520 [Erwinia psidii]|uniref:hypothetical protein n=1 Tax=Erwinia psidii TaxID=69224 RepID=UPI00226B00CB|nr:hypothetical protein [Erwinia psidii]MCX8956675.1 hypothetical protein [Erwinia psidii]MCX8960513.1 hypothetical protein [Erwinia psidii]MCX8964304.1 hypothetical protein [Erwinia psidii]
MIIKLTGIFIIGLCLVSFATCIIVYALHRKKYYRLLDEFQKKYTFPAPYSFHCLVGFFGAGPMAYFFLMLMKKKRVFFLDRDSEAYDFFENGNHKLSGWIAALYYSFMTSSVCCAIIAILGASLNLINRFSL